MYNFIKRMYETKREDGTYVYSDADLDVLVGKGYITEQQASEIKEFQQ